MSLPSFLSRWPISGTLSDFSLITNAGRQALVDIGLDPKDVAHFGVLGGGILAVQLL